MQPLRPGEQRARCTETRRIFLPERVLGADAISKRVSQPAQAGTVLYRASLQGTCKPASAEVEKLAMEKFSKVCSRSRPAWRSSLDAGMLTQSPCRVCLAAEEAAGASWGEAVPAACRQGSPVRWARWGACDSPRCQAFLPPPRGGSSRHTPPSALSLTPNNPPRRMLRRRTCLGMPTAAPSRIRSGDTSRRSSAR